MLFKGAAALETLAAVETFAFDKTGTLTTGRASVTQAVALDGDEDGFLSLLAGLEAQSEHHIAAAIRRAVAARGLSPFPVTDTANRPWQGHRRNRRLGHGLGGQPLLAAEMDADLGHPALAALDTGSQTLIYLGRGSQLLGAITRAPAPPPHWPRCGQAACGGS